MPEYHARATALRAIKQQLNITHTEAVAVLDDPRCEALCAYIDAYDLATYADAVAVLEDPRNQVLCENCGWTNSMACPECPGCGCYTGQCTGWRHAEYDTESGADDAHCFECGADRNGYGCDC
ncbi:hypothetical protein LO763_19640 [Glycomyces sp. A-F 0318]|uniref:hypothetical protein n=1 Tax=Glycomyces amatae TaxID=2881355 RepID=UPI001E2881B3|nr:hypothetical protein [Glycomyces amatae]